MESSKGLWFVSGLGLGAILGLLYAPRSGVETRELLSRKTDEGMDYVNRKSGELRQQASEYVDRGKEYIDRGKEAVSRTIDRGKEAVGRQKEQFQAAVDAGKQAYRESTAGSSYPTGTESSSGKI